MDTAEDFSWLDSLRRGAQDHPEHMEGFIELVHRRLDVTDHEARELLERPVAR